MRGPTRRAFRSLLIVGALAMGTVSTARSDAGDPLFAPNLAPHQVGLLTPPVQRPPEVVTPHEMGIHFAYATVYTVDGTAGRNTELDMETVRIGLAYTRRWAPGIALDLEIPWLWEGAGSFDGFLIDYHHALGLPNGGRPDGPRNRYRYQVTTPDGRYAPNARGWGLGDVRVDLRKRLATHLPGTFAVRATVELPTGRAADGRGNGHLDAGMGLLAATQPGRIRGFANLDVLYQGGSPDPALPLGKHWGLSAALGGSATTPAGHWGVTSQVQYRTTPYRTGIAALDRDVIMLAAGGRVSLPGRWALSLGFIEDLAVHASPDFTALFELRRSWGDQP